MLSITSWPGFLCNVILSEKRNMSISEKVAYLSQNIIES
jgi:hypothetical protein